MTEVEIEAQTTVATDSQVTPEVTEVTEESSGVAMEGQTGQKATKLRNVTVCDVIESETVKPSIQKSRQSPVRKRRKILDQCSTVDSSRSENVSFRKQPLTVKQMFASMKLKGKQVSQDSTVKKVHKIGIAIGQGASSISPVINT